MSFFLVDMMILLCSCYFLCCKIWTDIILCATFGPSLHFCITSLVDNLTPWALQSSAQLFLKIFSFTITVLLTSHLHFAFSTLDFSALKLLQRHKVGKLKSSILTKFHFILASYILYLNHLYNTPY